MAQRIFKNLKLKQWVVVYTCNSSIQMAETTGARVQGHLGLLSENLSQKPKVTTHKIICKWLGMRSCCYVWSRSVAFVKFSEGFIMLYPFLGALWSITDSWGQKRGLLRSFGHGGSVEGAAASSSEKNPGRGRMLFCLGSKAALLCHIHSRWYDYTFLSMEHRHFINSKFWGLSVVLYVFIYYLCIYIGGDVCMPECQNMHLEVRRKLWDPTFTSRVPTEFMRLTFAFCGSFFFFSLDKVFLALRDLVFVM